MSGFVVVVVNTDGAPVDRALLGRMTAAMAFRGPDAQHTHVEGHVGLGHALLATVDDYTEPPLPCSLDGAVWLTGDVRVDGRADLVANLRDHTTASLDTASDPELVLHAYRAWGERCVEHLIGDFAFAIWDGSREQLFCARDQMGNRPLYYVGAGRSLLVSNTLDALREHEAVSSTLREATIGEFLLRGYVTDPAATGLADVSRLPAAYTLTWRANRLGTERYWTFPIEGPIWYRDSREYAEHLSEVLRAVVQDRLRTPSVGMLMSGGLDSSSVAAVARSLSGNTSVHAHTVVVDHLVPDEERHYAGRVARHLGITVEFHPLVPSLREFLDRSEGTTPTPVPRHDPVADLARGAIHATAGHSRVALTGDGGDAAFLPWPRQLAQHVRALRLGAAVSSLWPYVSEFRRAPKLGLRTSLAGVRDDHDRGVPTDAPTWMQPDLVARTQTALRAWASSTPPAAVHADRETAYEAVTNPFWDRLMEEFDPGFTRIALQFRHPLLDLRFLRFALRLPSQPYCIDKYLLRRAMKGLLPEDVRRRRKTPARGDPLAAVLQSEWQRILRPIEPTASLARFVDFRQLPRSAERRPADIAAAKRSLLVFSLNRWLASVERTAGVSSAAVAVTAA